MSKTFGAPAITVEDAVYKECFDTIKTQVGLYRDKTKGSDASKNWANQKDELLKRLTEYFLVGKVLARQQSFTDFAQLLLDGFGITTPAQGALWGGDGAQDQAKLALGGAVGASVLSTSPLGNMAGKMKLSMQGPKSGETGPDYAIRNAASLQFWGAVSAQYAKALTGDVHVWMPKGLTVGSIFWNDELPVLMTRKRNGEDFKLIFHTNPGNWNEVVDFEDLVIGGAYVADKNGYYAGRAALKAQHNPATGANPALELKEAMTLTLKSPIKVATVRLAMQSLLTYHTMKKHNAALPKPISTAVLARLAVWQERARMEV
jgi:hypothetical protein